MIYITLKIKNFVKNRNLYVALQITTQSRSQILPKLFNYMAHSKQM